MSAKLGQHRDQEGSKRRKREEGVPEQGGQLEGGSWILTLFLGSRGGLV